MGVLFSLTTEGHIDVIRMTYMKYYFYVPFLPDKGVCRTNSSGFEI